MTKYLKTVILFFITFLFLQSSCAMAQTDIKDYLTQRFLKYCQAVPREEVFIHSDREEYIAGENLWFNIYLTDRQSIKPSLNSKIVYFELLNSVNKPVVQKRIWIEKGIGPGQVILPDTLSTGLYRVRAYTSWMKNFLPDNCFMKTIKIYNALNTTAFKGKMSSGNIFKGKTGNEIIRRNTNSGLTLIVNNLKTDILEILINADEEYQTQNNNLFYLFIQTHGIIDQVSSEKTAEGTAKITIPKTKLTAGINQITIFDSKGRPVCERYIYTPGREEQLFSLNSADSCNSRSKISLEIEPGNEFSKTLDSASFSISVTPEINDQETLNLNDYLVFGSEFGSLPWKKIRERKINELPAEEMDTLLLAVKSEWINWGTILSDDLPDFSYPIENEDHYLQGKLVTNDQQPADSNEFVLLSSPGKVAEFQYARTDNKGNFCFNIPVQKGLKDLIIQPDDVTKNFRVNIKSSFSDQYPEFKIPVDSTNGQVPHFISNWSTNYQVNKIYGSSSVGEPMIPVLQQIKPKRFYGKPDIELIMADYIKLPVMEEVFFELVPGFVLKKNKSGYSININDPVEREFYKGHPGLLIDGVIIKDATLIADLDPEIVEKIDAVDNKYFIGDYIFYGLVNIITKAGDFNCVTLPDYSIRLPYRVLDAVSSFKSPDYSTSEMKNSRIPDFRNTLYWNPCIKPDKEGMARIEFWTSDIKCDYKINIQGFTSDGKLFSIQKIIKVK
jgi:hypothetical protein